ncbi:MAG: hypothetical protein ABJJ48_03060, partial [Marinomonas sp.]
TPDFLDHFGLTSRRDLPGLGELRAAGLLDPVDDAFQALMGNDEDPDSPPDDEEITEDAHA